MLTGAHSIIYSTNAGADRAFLRDVLKLAHVDVGDGWLIFGLPPAEVAVHPSEENDFHEFYFLCADAGAFVEEMRKHGIACDPVQNQGYGLVTRVTLPGGGKLGVYQPRHARPPAMNSKTAKRPAARAPKAARKKTKSKPKSKSKSKRR